MLKLMLDENISPALNKPLWEMQVDTTSTRDRNMLKAGDHEVWKVAQDEDRSVVTINYGDFERLARLTPRHAGLVIIPSGRGRDGQLKLIQSVVESVRAENAVLPSFRGRVFKISEDGTISVEQTPDPQAARVALRVVS
ncbi:DUF5615 family PIN-like protein [Mesorhizobium sp. B2-6-2]|uniref:DUF5615 family PIN-like protein n=1 Tax=Mesorhizobium sp. B2-6-2 TaxID=2589915 RepID=UPI00112787AC|nr:DUF5615 family PIN-like protein [Mesorhizobium sp. B2-6-2]TPJ80942.1 hypothetical protein FJ419_05720 [Mesorhizobium sp. B2-6-2]